MGGTRTRRLKMTVLVICATAATFATIGVNAAAATPATEPVTVNFTAATRGFDILVKDDALIQRGTESEGAAAVGGTLRFGTFQLMGHDNPGKIPGDDHVGLLTGGTVGLNGSAGTLNINNAGHLKIGDMTGLKVVGNADQGGVINGNNRALVSTSGDYNSTPRVHVNGGSQDPSSVPAPGLFGELFDDTFTQFSQLNSCLAAQPTTDGLTLHDLDRPSSDNVIDLSQTSGKKVRLELVQGKVNIWTVSVSQLNSMAEIGFVNDAGNPSMTTPLVINVIGSGALAPTLLVNGDRDSALRSILWNLSSDVALSGSRPLPGTFFAPNNALAVNITNNVEGQLIGKSLNVESIGEQHTHQFGATLTCGTKPTPTTSPSPTLSPSPTVSPSPTQTPSPTATPTPTKTSSATPPGPTPPTDDKLANTGGYLPVYIIGLAIVLVAVGGVLVRSHRRRAQR